MSENAEFWQLMDGAPLADFRRLVRQPEFAEAKICSICAVRIGVVWPMRTVAPFVEGECPCCGRQTKITAIESWNWNQEDAGGGMESKDESNI